MAALQITPRCWRHSRWHRQTGSSRAIYLRSCNAPPALDLCSIISVHSAYSALRGLLAINYPERGKDAHCPGQCRRSGRRGTTVALLQLVERRDARRTRPGHFSRNLSSAQEDVVELPRGQNCPIGARMELLFRWLRE